MKKASRKKRISLRFLMVLFVFLIMLASVLLIGLVMGFLMHTGLFNPFAGERSPLVPVVGMLVFSTLMGTVLTGLVGNRTLKPLRKVIEATNKVAEGISRCAWR